MEIERDFEMFLPRSTPNLRASTFFKEMSQSFAFRFQKQSMVDKLQHIILPHLLEGMESLNDSLAILPSPVHAVSHPWQVILDYLYREGAITQPRFSIIAPRNDEPKFYFASLPPVLDESILATIFGSFGQGYALHLEEAMAKALGEFLERYALFSVGYKDLVFKSATLAELQRSRYAFIHPSEVSHFSREQRLEYSKLCFDDSSQFQWVEGKRVYDGKKILVPAQLVFWDYFRGHEDEPLLHESNTNGSGGMFSRTEAILAGLYELIERDAFFIFWLNSLAPPRIDLETINDSDIQHIIASCRRYQLRLEVLDVTSDINIPVFVAVLLGGNGKELQIGVGAGCKMDPREGLKSAILEAIAVYHEIARFRGKNLPTTELLMSGSPRIIMNPQQRLVFWTGTEVCQNIEWFLKGKTISFQERESNRMCFSHPKKELNFLVEKLRKKGLGYEPYYYEAGHPILDAFSYHVVQVIVPALVPHYLYAEHAPLGAKRLGDVSIHNKIPHPLM